MEWDLFDERIQQVAASAVDPLGPMPALLEPDYPVLEWQNFIKIPVMPTLTDLRSPPSVVARSLLMAHWFLAALSVILLWRLVAAVRNHTPLRTGLAAALSYPCWLPRRPRGPAVTPGSPPLPLTMS